MLVSALNISYWLSALVMVIGLRRLSSPDTARKGNILAGAGMTLAILTALIYPTEGASNNYAWIILAMIIGTAVGIFTSKKVQMTQMPQLVSIFNGLGGACAVLLACVEFLPFITEVSPDKGKVFVLIFTLLIGGIAFTGSILAYLKLDGKVWDSQVTLPRHNILNNVLLLVLVGLSIYMMLNSAYTLGTIGALTVLSLIYGFSFVAPIGGADMPVVISLLNSFTGLSAAAAGLIYDSQIMLIGGILVGASGTILTVLMCQAMNRSLFNVLIGGFTSSGGAKAKKTGEQTAKEVTYSDAAVQLFYSGSVMIVPGYGLAVAQAQKVCKDLDELLTANGVEVKYAIHPVAGRMPGHMNVLLAEADVPYPKLLDMDEANDKLSDTDIVIVVGANDVVNPAAEDDPGSSIYGMPVLSVWRAKNVIVLKRSMRPGYAGIQNQLFFHAKTRMLFGDAKKSMEVLVKEVKDLQ